MEPRGATWGHIQTFQIKIMGSAEPHTNIQIKTTIAENSAAWSCKISEQKLFCKVILLNPDVA